MTTPGGDEGGNASIEEYARFADATRGALDIAAEGRLSVAWKHDGTTETAWVLFVSSNYFEMVKARPIAGRIDVSPAAGGPPSVVIGERFWRRKLNAASPAGLTLRLNNTDVAVAGVLPDSFTGPSGLYSPDVWLPLDATRGLQHVTRAAEARHAMALRPGPHEAGHERARRSRDASTPRWPRWRTTGPTRTASAAPDSGCSREANQRAPADVKIAAGIVMGIIGLVLLLACFNVANLLLARAVERERDMGIRAALGASAGRLVRLVMAEGVDDCRPRRCRRAGARALDAVAGRLVRHSNRAAAARRSDA